ncbi:hypothetical protein [Paraburkholderia sp. HD33-4]|uniref:hypothetical protein n=1 Tax=Paraburkholderia sp. HD33-4 TaxID=2883242 RepID=UPI001F3337BE|nr:hypothetical protein [Paraburkholderia sp. HD33-4]
MPKKHLVLEQSSGQIVVHDGNRPAESEYSETFRDPNVFFGRVPIYDVKGTKPETRRSAIADFLHRMGYAKLFGDTCSAVQQLIQKCGEDGVGYIAVGGSPKLVKWLLKYRGFKVVTVNVSEVSKVELEHAPTSDFKRYLARKLEKLGNPGRYIVLDFADTGDSLIKLKRDVKDTLEQAGRSAEVLAVAVGGSPKFFSEKNTTKREQIIVLDGIPDLTEVLHKQLLKNYILGRNKAKNPYATWSEEQSKKLEVPTQAGIKDHTHYQTMKTALPKLIGMGRIQVDIVDLLDNLNPEGTGPQSDDASGGTAALQEEGSNDDDYTW